MIEKIVKGYSALLGSAGRVLILLAACTAIGCALVFPLWAFATKAPAAYTGAVLLLLLAGLVFFIIKKAQASGARASLRFLLRLCIIAAGIAGAVGAVLAGSRLLALLALLLAVVLYGVTTFGFSPRPAAAHEFHDPGHPQA